MGVRFPPEALYNTKISRGGGMVDTHALRACRSNPVGVRVSPSALIRGFPILLEFLLVLQNFLRLR